MERNNHLFPGSCHRPVNTWQVLMWAPNTRGRRSLLRVVINAVCPKRRCYLDQMAPGSGFKHSLFSPNADVSFIHCRPFIHISIWTDVECGFSSVWAHSRKPSRRNVGFFEDKRSHVAWREPRRAWSRARRPPARMRSPSQRRTAIIGMWGG